MKKTALSLSLLFLIHSPLVYSKNYELIDRMNEIKMNPDLEKALEHFEFNLPDEQKDKSEDETEKNKKQSRLLIYGTVAGVSLLFLAALSAMYFMPR